MPGLRACGVLRAWHRRVDGMTPGDTSSNSRPYQPISCSLHDHLEAAATLGRPVPITYRGDDGGEVRREDRIIDIVARDGVEFLKLEQGGTIRLDDLVMVGDVPFAPPGECRN